MSRLVRSIIINAKPEAIFPYFYPEKISRWYGPEANTQVTQVSADSFGMGSRLRILLEQGGELLDYQVEVTDFVPNQRLTWRSIGQNPPSGVRLTLTPVSGGTKVELIEMYTVPGILGTLVDYLFMGKQVGKKIEEFLANLQRLVEG